MLRRILSCTLLVALLAGLALIGIRLSATASGPVYAPSTIVAGLARQPTAWLGRVIQVRGWSASPAVAPLSRYCAASPCPDTAGGATALLWDGAPKGDAPSSARA